MDGHLQDLGKNGTNIYYRKKASLWRPALRIDALGNVVLQNSAIHMDVTLTHTTLGLMHTTCGKSSLNASSICQNLPVF